MMVNNTGLDWVEELLQSHWRLWFGVVAGALVGYHANYFFGSGTALKLGQWLTFISAVTFLFMQEIESHALKKELVVVAKQAEGLMNKSIPDHSEVGVSTRLSDPKRMRLINLFKKWSLVCAVFGAVFTWN
jgi:hypothetical protein